MQYSKQAHTRSTEHNWEVLLRLLYMPKQRSGWGSLRVLATAQLHSRPITCIRCDRNFVLCTEHRKCFGFMWFGLSAVVWHLKCVGERLALEWPRRCRERRSKRAICETPSGFRSASDLGPSLSSVSPEGCFDKRLGQVLVMAPVHGNSGCVCPQYGACVAVFDSLLFS